MYGVDSSALLAAFNRTNDTLMSLESLYAQANTCLSNAQTFFSLAQAAQVSGGTSVDFGSVLGEYNSVLTNIGNQIVEFGNVNVGISGVLGKKINDMNVNGLDLEHGYANVGGEQVHLNSKYVNGESIISGLAVSDANGKVISSLVISGVYVDSETQKTMYKLSNGKTYSESDLENWLKKEYYNDNGTVKNGLNLSVLLGNKTNENNNSYDISPMAWIDGSSMNVGSNIGTGLYQINIDKKEKQETDAEKVINAMAGYALGTVAKDTFGADPDGTRFGGSVGLISASGQHTPYDGEFFKQTDSRWSGESLGGSNTTIGRAGCFITSVLNQIVRSGTKTEVENPTPSDANELFDIDSNGGFSATRDVSKLAPNFEPVKEEWMTDMSKDEITKLLTSMPDNYYVVFNVTAPSGNDHYVALNYVGDDGSLHIMDPSYGFEELYSGYGKPLKYYVWKKTD